MIGKLCTYLLIPIGLFFVSATVYDPALVLTNKLLMSFVHDQMINIVAILVTITTASAGQLHLSLNEIERVEKKVLFIRTRKEIRDNVLWIVGIFIVEIALLLLLDWVENKRGDAFIVGAMVTALILAILLMYDIVDSIFKIPAFTSGGSAAPITNPPTAPPPVPAPQGTPERT
jgi:hypothetical protein